MPWQYKTYCALKKIKLIQSFFAEFVPPQTEFNSQTTRSIQRITIFCFILSVKEKTHCRNSGC